MIKNGQKFPCAPDDEALKKINQKECRDAWLQAEARGFGRGTAEFCSFAIDVAPFTPGQLRTNCEGESSRFVIGNGKGKPKLGPLVPNATGGMSQSYVSTTAIDHIVNGKRVALDSNTVPALVTPRGRGDLRGAVAWVKHENQSTFAIMGDIGPAWGEGSVALHELLRYGAGSPQHIVGPIPISDRCKSIETGLRPPFTSSPDPGGSKCGQLGTPTVKSDIRAKINIDGDVQMVILPGVKLPMTGTSLVNVEVTTSALEAAALQAGYSKDKLSSMACCTAQVTRP
jgi:hypothetical protein